MARQKKSDLDTNNAQAAYWFTRMNSGEASEQEQYEFTKWLNENPANAQNYRYVRYFCDASFLSTEPLPALEPVTSITDEQLSSHAWHYLWGGVLFLVGMLLVLFILQSESQPWQSTPKQVLHAFDARQEYTLKDGSLLVLNKGSHLRYDEKRQHFYLDQGQVYFDVDAQRQAPMTISAGDSEIRVMGTSFDVMKDGSTVRITVESGHVEVASGSLWRKRTRLLVPGQSVEVDDWRGMQRVTVAPVKMRLAWVKGKFLFDNTPLPEVLTELNRYRQQALRLSPGKGLETLLFSGEFSLDEPEAVLQALLESLPIKMALEADGVLSPYVHPQA